MSSILELDIHSEKRKSVEDVFFSIFTALFDALVLRAQVIIIITFLISFSYIIIISNNY